MKYNHKGLRTWVEIDEKALLNNYKVFRNLIAKNCKLMAVVKSNAYGHDFRAFSQTISKIGADWLGVDSITEALALRKMGIRKPILVLGFTLPERFNEAVANQISLTISSLEVLRALQKFKSRNQLLIHLKIDTGMHRQGIQFAEIPEAMEILRNLDRKVKFEGLYTHFASAKNPGESKDTILQITQFKKVAVLIHKSGFKPIRHAAATGGTIVYPESHFDMVRVGIGLYGLWPSPQIQESFEEKLQLTRVLSFKSVISEVKNLPKGSKIGYDGTEILEKNSVIGICPVGYWHGLPRNLSSIGCVLLKGKRCKIIGRISMDMTIIDVSGVSTPKIGDVVTIIGKDGKEEITASELAKLAGTINYEIVTLLNPLMRRIYL